MEEDYDDGCAKTRDFELTPRVYSKIDSRCGELGGLEGDWISPGLLPMKHTGSVKAADCRRLLWHAGDYIFYDLFGYKQPAVESWMDILRKVEQSTADFDHDNAYAEIAALKMQVAEALTNFESDWPPQSHCIVAHELMHVPDCIYRWNSVRNYWAFHLERYALTHSHEITFLTSDFKPDVKADVEYVAPQVCRLDHELHPQPQGP